MSLKKQMYEDLTLKMFRSTKAGKFVELLLLVIPLSLIFVYHQFGLHIIFAVILGFLTRSILGALVDILVSKFFRIDKQIEWLTQTTDGLAELKRRGVNIEQIHSFEKEVGLDVIKNYKCFIVPFFLGALQYN